MKNFSLQTVLSHVRCKKEKTNKQKVETLSKSSVHLETIQRYRDNLGGKSVRNYVGGRGCSRCCLSSHVCISWRSALLLWGRKYGAFTNWCTSNQSSFHYAKKLLTKTLGSLLTTLLQGIGLLWLLTLKRCLKRCLMEIDCVCVCVYSIFFETSFLTHCFLELSCLIPTCLEIF